MNCPGPEDWIAFYGGEIEEARLHGMAAHLDECLRCQDEFDRLTRLGAGIRGALSQPQRRARPARRRARPAQSRRVPLAAAAALLLAALGLVLLRQPAPEPGLPGVARSPVAVPPVEPPPAPPPPAPPIPPAPQEPDFVIPERPPAPPPVPPPPAPPPPMVDPAPAPRSAATAVAIASFQQGAQSRPLQDGDPASGRGLVTFPDGTRLALGDDTAIARISDRAGAGGVGKWVELSRGTVTVEAAHQPEGRAMTIATPHGEARVVGTVLQLAVEADATRLEVTEGKVRLSRPGAGTVDVVGGFAAVAAPDRELAARPLARMTVEVVHRFTFEDGRLPKLFDTGQVEKGPDNRSCVAGALLPGATAGGHVKLSDDPKGLFAYTDDLFLSFDYWADASARTLDLHVWSRAQQVTFGTTVWNTPNERWTHLVLPLADFIRTEPDRLLHLRPGEAVPNLWIQAGQPGAKLYLDNLELVRVRAPQPRKKP